MVPLSWSLQMDYGVKRRCRKSQNYSPGKEADYNSSPALSAPIKVLTTKLGKLLEPQGEGPPLFESVMT